MINKTISIWKGERFPPTPYHLWLKDSLQSGDTGDIEEIVDEDSVKDNGAGLYECVDPENYLNLDSWVLISGSGGGSDCNAIDVENDLLKNILI